MGRYCARGVVFFALTVLVAALAIPVTASAEPMVIPAGQQFCPTSTFSAGGVTIAGGQCYLVATVANSNGTFLAFLPPAATIAAGQVIDVTTPAGTALLTPQVPLVPITLASGVTIPANTLTAVPVSVDLAASQPVILLSGGPAAKTSVIVTVAPAAAAVPAAPAPVAVAPAPAAPVAFVSTGTTTLTPGQAFCPANDLVFGDTIVAGGQCYMVATLRNHKGAFLVFLPQSAAIKSGQLVLVNDTGAPLITSDVRVVPIAVTSVNSMISMPMDTVTLVPVSVDLSAPQPVITVTSGVIANSVVMFTSRPHEQ